MFLMPQHFQAQDEYFEQELNFRSNAATFANWGLTGIGVDEASLTNGFFTLRHCEGVLPDGVTWVGAGIIVGSGLYLIRRDGVAAAAARPPGESV